MPKALGVSVMDGNMSGTLILVFVCVAGVIILSSINSIRKSLKYYEIIFRIFLILFGSLPLLLVFTRTVDESGINLIVGLFAFILFSILIKPKEDGV